MNVSLLRVWRWIRFALVLALECIVLILFNALCLLNYCLHGCGVITLRHYRSNVEFLMHRMACVVVWGVENVAGLRFVFSGNLDVFSTITSTPEKTLVFANHVCHLGEY